MRCSSALAITAAAAALLANAAVAAAPDMSGPNVAERAAAPTPASTSVAEAHLAAELADYGRRARSPLALVLAAEMTARNAGPETPRPKTSDGGEADAGARPAETAKTPRPPITAASLLDEARALAGPDLAAIQPQLQRVAAMESRGRMGAPGFTRTRVRAGQTDRFIVPFRGGEPAIVTVIGDGDTDLDLYVEDQNGRRVCSDTDYTDRLLCIWTPLWTSSYTIRVKNYGSVYNEYTMRTN